jgi:hypothetical protein
MGFSGQLTTWPDSLCEGRLASNGFRVIRFDNRDIGKSTHLTELGRPDLAAMIAKLEARETPIAPYSLDDMAADAAGLLTALAGAYRGRLDGRDDRAQGLPIAVLSVFKGLEKRAGSNWTDENGGGLPVLAACEPEPRMRQPRWIPYQILGIEAFQGHIISGLEFNLFKPLRWHSRDSGPSDFVPTLLLSPRVGSLWARRFQKIASASVRNASGTRVKVAKRLPKASFPSFFFPESNVIKGLPAISAHKSFSRALLPPEPPIPAAEPRRGPGP